MAWATGAAISALAFSVYLLGVDGVAAALTQLPIFASPDQHRHLLAATAVRVVVELLAGLVAFGFSTSKKITGNWLIFWLVLAVYNLFGVGEMLFYTGVLDERHFFNLALFGGPIVEKAVRVMTLLAGGLLYLWFVSITAKVARRLKGSINSLVAAAFVTPLVMIVLYFLTIPSLRFNVIEYVRFIVYYSGMSIGLLAFPKLRTGYDTGIQSAEAPTNRTWLIAGILGSLLYIFQARVHELFGR